MYLDLFSKKKKKKKNLIQPCNSGLHYVVDDAFLWFLRCRQCCPRAAERLLKAGPFHMQYLSA